MNSLLSNNNLLLQFYNKRDNSPIQFESIEYKINVLNDKQIYFYSKYKISITHLFIYNKNTQQFSNTDYSDVFVNNIGNQKLTDYYYKLDTPITLEKNINNTINIHNTNATYPFYIILLSDNTNLIIVYCGILIPHYSPIMFIFLIKLVLVLLLFLNNFIYKMTLKFPKISVLIKILQVIHLILIIL